MSYGPDRVRMFLVGIEGDHNTGHIYNMDHPHLDEHFPYEGEPLKVPR